MLARLLLNQVWREAGTRNYIAVFSKKSWRYHYFQAFFM